MAAPAELLDYEPSLAERLASIDPPDEPPEKRVELLNHFDTRERDALRYDWRFWARPKQLPPEGDWGLWVVRAGRGFGKTRAGAGWVHGRAMEEPRWIALVAATPADARDYMIEGPGGILEHTHPDERPHYEPSKRRLTWPNGSWGTVYSAEKPDQLRGYSGDTAWMDEFAKWANPRECWRMLMFGMREASADRPRVLITTTPRPLTVLKELEERDSTVTTVGSSFENYRNLSKEWYAETIEPLLGTRMGRQEIMAEILDDVPGALWTRAMLPDRAPFRLDEAPPLERIVVGVDPAVTSGEDSDRTGILVAGRGADGHAYVLDDLTCRKSPREWARDAIAAYEFWSADRVVAEVNNGGDLVEHVLRSVDPAVSYRSVHASRGKRVRAEPIAALYERRRVHHVGTFPDLEDEMCNFVADAREGSPDRVDALVWALTELMLKPVTEPPKPRRLKRTWA